MDKVYDGLNLVKLIDAPAACQKDQINVVMSEKILIDEVAELFTSAGIFGVSLQRGNAGCRTGETRQLGLDKAGVHDCRR